MCIMELVSFTTGVKLTGIKTCRSKLNVKFNN